MIVHRGLAAERNLLGAEHKLLVDFARKLLVDFGNSHLDVAGRSLDASFAEGAPFVH